MCHVREAAKCTAERVAEPRNLENTDWPLRSTGIWGARHFNTAEAVSEDVSNFSNNSSRGTPLSAPFPFPSVSRTINNPPARVLSLYFSPYRVLLSCGEWNEQKVRNRSKFINPYRTRPLLPSTLKSHYFIMMTSFSGYSVRVPYIFRYSLHWEKMKKLYNLIVHSPLYYQGRISTPSTWKIIIIIRLKIKMLA